MEEEDFDNISSTEVSTTPDAATYIARHLGAQHLPLTTIIPISVVYAIIFVVGVLGNVSTIVVILRNKYMHTPTNVYLANLAISDLLTHLVAMPFELYWLWRQYPWVFGEVICDAKMLTTETVTYSSILTIMAFTVERYLAICRPLAIPRRHSKMTRAVWALLAIWIASVSFSLPWIYYNKVNYLTNEYTKEVMEDSAWCAVPWNEDAKTPFYLMISSTVVAFIIPFSLVTILYYRIGVAMKKSSALKRCAAHGSGMECEAEITYNKGRQAVVRMLAAVVVVFFVCWTPFHAQRLMFVIVTLQGKWTHTNGKAHHVLFLASGVGYYLSSCVNPLLYSVMSKRFRRGFSDMFKRGGGGGAQSVNSAVAAAAAAAALAAAASPCNGNGNGNGMHPCNGGGGGGRTSGREVARYELKMAPRHVIPPQCKEDILKKAFRNHDDLSSISFGSRSLNYADCQSVKPKLPPSSFSNHSDQNLSSSSSTIRYGTASMLSKSPKLVVSWKRPNEKNGYSIDGSKVQIKVDGSHDNSLSSRSQSPVLNKSSKPAKKKLLRFSPNLATSEGESVSADGDSNISCGVRKLKSDGDTPDCFSEELAEMIADSVRIDAMKSGFK